MKQQVDESCLFLAARYLRRQIKQIADQVEGIRKAEDIEFVHRARVASRRLRSALQLFGNLFPADRLKVWKKEIRRLGRDLGDARDRDVQIEFLADRLRHLESPAFAPGIARVLVQWERKREAAQPKALRAVRRLLESRVLHQMLSATKKMAPNAKKEALPLPTPQTYEQIELQILVYFDAFHAIRDSLADPTNIQQHHAMRIAAKRLRYALECCKSLYAGRVDGVLEAIKQVQSLLGDIHDCDVWIAQLTAALQKEQKRIRLLFEHDGPIARLKPGIAHLQEDRRRRRAERFDTLVQYWADLQGAGLWDDLRAAVRFRGARTSAAASSAPVAQDSPDRGSAAPGQQPSNSAGQQPSEIASQQPSGIAGQPAGSAKSLQQRA
jgi:CHAD domain-containing protein